MMSEMETESLQDLHAELFIYMLQKLAIADTSSEESYFGLQDEYLVIEGDQKLYEVLQSLKFEYGKELDWVIPFPGDWHMLSWR